MALHVLKGCHQYDAAKDQEECLEEEGVPVYQEEALVEIISRPPQVYEREGKDPAEAQHREIDQQMLPVRPHEEVHGKDQKGQPRYEELGQQ